MQEWILVVAADVRQTSHGTVVVGKETARVCIRAAEVARKHPEAFVCVPAGWSKRYRVYVGQGPMKTYLEFQRVPAERIVAPVDLRSPFRTIGEMRTFAKTLCRCRAEGEAQKVTVVVRWWHAPRALVLLLRVLHKNKLGARVTVVPVWTFFDWTMCLEPLRWIRNIPDVITG